MNRTQTPKKYSLVLEYFWDKYKIQKQYTPQASNDEVYQMLIRSPLKSPLNKGESAESRELIVTGFELWKEDLNMNFLHLYFLDRSLKDFLIKTKLTDSLDDLREHLYNDGKSKEVVYTRTGGKENCITYSYGIHIPSEKNGYGFMLQLFEDSRIELFFCHGDKFGMHSSSLYNQYNNSKDPKYRRLSEVFRLAINTLAYIKCFPDCIKEGPPSLILNNLSDINKGSLTLGLSDKVTHNNKTNSSKTPHFRQGHFRVLKSDYYKEARGQVIFVESTMVKGRAKSISKSKRLGDFS